MKKLEFVALATIVSLVGVGTFALGQGKGMGQGQGTGQSQCVDTNNNGICDGQEDWDNDGIVNSQDPDYEKQYVNQTDKMQDTNNNGIPDGQEDWDNDGIPNNQDEDYKAYKKSLGSGENLRGSNSKGNRFSQKKQLLARNLGNVAKQVDTVMTGYFAKLSNMSVEDQITKLQNVMNRIDAAEEKIQSITDESKKELLENLLEYLKVTIEEKLAELNA